MSQQTQGGYVPPPLPPLGSGLPDLGGLVPPPPAGGGTGQPTPFQTAATEQQPSTSGGGLGILGVFDPLAAPGAPPVVGNRPTTATTILGAGGSGGTTGTTSSLLVEPPRPQGLSSDGPLGPPPPVLDIPDISNVDSRYSTPNSSQPHTNKSSNRTNAAPSSSTHPAGSYQSGGGAGGVNQHDTMMSASAGERDSSMMLHSPSGKNSGGLKKSLLKKSQKSSKAPDTTVVRGSDNIYGATDTLEASTKPGVNNQGGVAGDEKDSNETFAALFNDYAQDGFITGTDLCDILVALGLPSDVGTVESLLAVDWAEVDFEAAQDVVFVLKGTQETLEKADDQVDQKKGDQEISISFSEFIWKTITCSKEADTKYQVQAPTLDLKPRQMLMSTTSLVMLFTGGLIIMTIGLLWVQQAREGERRSMRNFGDAMSSFIENFEAELMTRNGVELSDVAAIIAQAEDQRSILEIDSLTQRFQREAESISASLSLVDKQLLNSKLKRYGLYLSTVATSLRQTAPDSYSNSSSIQSVLAARASAVASYLGTNWTVAVFPGLIRTTDAATGLTTDTYPGNPLFLHNGPCVSVACTWSGVAWLRNMLLDVYSQPGSLAAARSVETARLAEATTTMSIAEAQLAARQTSLRIRAVQSEEAVGPRGTGIAYTCVPLPIDAANGDSFRGAMCAIVEQTELNAEAQLRHKTNPLFDRDDQYSHVPSAEVAKFSAYKELATLSDSDGLTTTWLRESPALSGSGFASCYHPDNSSSGCNDINALTYGAIRSQQVVATRISQGPRSGLPDVVVVSPNHLGQDAVLLTMPQSKFVQAGWSELSEVFAHLNFVRIQLAGATVETVLMLRNQTIQEMYQASPFAFLDDCLGDCVRRKEALVNAELVWNQGIVTHSITPDYRPEPVMGGGGGARRLMDFVVLVERDVIEIRKITMTSLAAMLNDNNRQFQGSFEVQMLHHLDQPLTKTYDPTPPFDACTATVGCVISGSFGVVYRTDCTHCSRFIPTSVTWTTPQRPMEYLTSPSLRSTCSGPCPMEAIENNPSDIGRIAVDGAQESGVFDHHDYRGIRTIGYFGRADNFTAAFYVKQDYDDVFQPINVQIYISLGSSVGIVIVSLVILFCLGRTLIDDIEADWLHYKENIQEERKAFADSVRGILPAHFAEKVMVGNTMTVENRSISVAFIEIMGMGARSTNWSPLTFSRFLTYVFHLSELLAVNHDIYRLRTVGDVSIFIGGVSAAQDIGGGADKSGEGVNDASATLGRTAGANHSLFGGKGDVKSASGSGSGGGKYKSGRYLGGMETTSTSYGMHHVVRLLHFISNFFQGASKRFAHFPHRAALMEKTFGTFSSDFPDKQGLSEHVGTCVMPVARAGVHVGSASLCVLNSGKTPHFDVYGSPLMGIAKRISHHARATSVRCTEAIVEQIRKSPQAEVFAFDRPHTTLIRGRGMVTTYELAVADVQAPLSLLQEVGVRFSKRRKMFSFERDETPEHSVLSGSIVSGSTATYKGQDPLGPEGK